MRQKFYMLLHRLISWKKCRPHIFFPRMSPAAKQSDVAFVIANEEIIAWSDEEDSDVNSGWQCGRRINILLHAAGQKVGGRGDASFMV